jgi:arylsulfatase A-like enzyme
VVLLAAASVLLLPAPRRPHLVVLLWDTTRADRLSACGYARPTTPWLEGVAADGVLFEQCRAPSPWTLPSHASIFTGLLPRHHGAVTLESPLAPAHRTLAERLREAGYDTVLLSNNPLVHPDAGLGQGFGVFRDVAKEGGRQGWRETLAVLGRELAARREDPDRAGRPLFLFVNLMEPHLPYEPPPDLERPWRPGGTTEEEAAAARRFQFPEDMAHNLGVRRLDARAIAVLSSLYDAEILSLDGGCRAIEAALAREGILGPGSDSLLVVTSDHGENLGEEGLLDHKLSVGEPLLRVPLVLRGAGLFEGGRRERAAVRLQDLFPTLLAAAGVPPAPGDAPHAASLLGPPGPGRTQVAEFAPPLSFADGMRRTFPGQPDAVLAPFARGLLAAVGPEEDGRRLKWRRTWTPGRGGGVEVLREALFDLEADPREERDLLGAGATDARDAAAAAALRALAEEWVAPR